MTMSRDGYFHAEPNIRRIEDNGDFTVADRLDLRYCESFCQTYGVLTILRYESGTVCADCREEQERDTARA